MKIRYDSMGRVINPRTNTPFLKDDCKWCYANSCYMCPVGDRDQYKDNNELTDEEWKDARRTNES